LLNAEKKIYSKQKMKEKYLMKELKLINAVEKHIGFDRKTGLLKDKINSNNSSLDTFENVSMAISYVLIGKEKEAGKLILAVENLIGFDENVMLIKNKLGSKNIFLSDNALLILGYLLLSKIQNAWNLLNAIESYIGFDKESGLVKNGPNRPEIYSFNSLLLAIDYSVLGHIEKAKKLFGVVCTRIGFDQKTHLLKGIGNKKKRSKNRGIFTLDNAILVVYYVLTDKWDEAERILLGIESYIGFDTSTGLVKKGLTPEHRGLYSYVNNMLALAYLSLADNLTMRLQNLPIDFNLIRKNK